MSHILFKKLTVQNFKSIGEETVIDFDKLRKISLIKGINHDVEINDSEVTANNGSGKSTIIDAILFALYGKTLCGLNNRDLINRSIGTELKTFSKLEFSIGTDSYVSEAFLNIKGKSDPTIGFTLQINDEEPISRNTLQMKTMIEDQILGCPFDLFKSSIVISQSSYQNFYMMTKSQKVSYIEDLFKLMIFGDLLKLVRSDVRTDTAEYNATSMARMSVVDQLQDLVIKNNKFESEAKSRNDNIQTAIDLKKKAIEALENDLKKYEETIDADETELEKECISLRGQYDEKIAYNRKLVAAASSLMSQKSELDNIINKHKTVLDILCDNCMEKADGILNISETKEKIADIESKVEKVKTASQETMEQISEIQKKHDELRKQIENIRSVKHKKEMIINQIESTNREIETLDNALEQSQLQENPFEGLIEKNKSQIEEYDKLMSDKSIMVKIKKFIEMVFSDSGAKKAILNDISSNINKLIHHYLIKLGANYMVIFDSSFTPKFVTQNGESVFESFSSGEKQRINLATMMAFRDLVIGNRISSNIFILDEVIDGALDSSGLIGITTSIVEMISNSNTKLMLVSHNPSVEQKLKELSDVSLIIAEKRDSKTRYKIVD